MKVFIWQRVATITENWHSEGGVVVFAETEERAREIVSIKARADASNFGHDEQLSKIGIRPDEKPDYIREVESGEEKVFIFPDAGCC